MPKNVGFVALGDSQTYGTGVCRNEAWPQQLSQISGLSGYNMACGSWSAPHSLILWDEARDLSPQIVIEAVYAGNDLCDAYSFVYEHSKLERFHSDDAAVLESIRKSEEQGSLASKIESHLNMKPLSQLAQPAPQRPLHKRLGQAFSSHSMVDALWHITRRRIRDTFSDEWKRTLRNLRHKMDYLQVLTIREHRTIFTSQYRMCALDRGDPRIREGSRIVNEALKELNQDVTNHGAQFVVLLIPTKELVYWETVQEASVDLDPIYEQVVRTEQSFWNDLRQFLTAEQIDHVSALPALRQCLKDGERAYPASENGHPAPPGYRAIARLVDEHLASTQGNSH